MQLHPVTFGSTPGTIELVRHVPSYDIRRIYVTTLVARIELFENDTGCLLAFLDLCDRLAA